jgi:AcrR family transcriptional regulator
MRTAPKKKSRARNRAVRGRPAANGRTAARGGSRLSRERIADAAVALVDRDGLEALSFRNLGAEVGCEAMSIYHHFPSKAHLMDALVDLMLAEITIQSVADQPDWIARLRHTAHSFRAVALKHPKLFPFFAVHRLNTRLGVSFIDGTIGILREAGFPPEPASRYFRTIGYYLTGAALDETHGYAKGPSAAEPVSNEVIAAEFGHLAASARFFQSRYFQSTFEDGLEMLLAGVARAHKALASLRGN